MKIDSAISASPTLLSRAAPEIDMTRIDETARDFEAMFITEMMRPMFEGIEVNETFGGGKGEEVFRGFMLEEYGKTMAETSALGIADLVKAQLIEMQSAANKAAMAQNMHNEIEEGAK